MASRTVLVTSANVLVTLAIVAAYHALVAPRPQPAGPSSAPATAPSAPSDDALAALRRRVLALEQASAGSRPSGDVSAGDLSTLLARVAALEERVIPSSADAGARALAHLPPGVDSKAGPFSEDQIATLRAMLDEVDVRRAMDRETASYRDLVKRVLPETSAAAQSATVSLITDYMRRLRSLFGGASAGKTEEERAATFAKAREQHAKLLADLAGVLTRPEIDQISPHLPDPGTPAGHTPPNVTVNPAAMDAGK